VLNVISRENEIFENTEAFVTVESLVKETASDTYFPLTHYTYDDTVSGKIEYLVTDIITREQAGTPLFYQYELLYDVSVDEDSYPITVYKNNESILPKESYSIQYSYDLVVNSGRYTDTQWGNINASNNIHRIRILLPITASNEDDFYVVTYKKYMYGSVTDQRELISLKSLYTDSDYYIDSSGVALTVTSNISSTTSALYIVKDPIKRIRPIGVEPPIYQPDGINNWRIRFSPGSIFVPSGMFSGANKVAYKLTNQYNDSPMQITSIKPSYISDDIIRVDQAPIYIDQSYFTYPQYKIRTYDRTSFIITEPGGQIGISVNGNNIPGLAIKSIDLEKGYIHLNQSLDPTSEIEFDYYVNNSGYIAVNNLELNPKATGVLQYHISGYLNGMGLAMRPYDSGNLDTELLYIYDSTIAEANRSGYSIPPVGDTPTGIAWSSEDFFTVCNVNLNRLTKDIVKITDARQINGIERTDINSTLDATTISGLSRHECDWYTDTGYYGGEPLSFGGAMVIHVPSGAFYGARDQWIAAMEDVVDDTIEAYEKGTKEFNFYLDQVIKRYVSGGTSYILIPVDSSGSFMDIERLEY
jgi:hypothetical protein